MVSEDEDFEVADNGLSMDSRVAGVRSSNSKRQRHGSEDESQQSILKWMRHVPGPLHDVMKKQADQMDSQHGERLSQMTSATSQGFSMKIGTVFDRGPWVDMCQFLGMKVVPGEQNGGIKVGSLKHTVYGLVNDDNAPTKVPQLLVLIKSMRYVDEEIVSVFHDPSGGVIEGYLHRELVEQLGPALSSGTALLLCNVSVFTPTDAPVSGKRTSYLNITPRNLRRVFIAKSESSSSASYEAMVEQFNQDKQSEGPEEDGFDDMDIKQTDGNHQTGRHLLRQQAVRNTSAELAFLSQRQVVHRNPPVRPDPDAASAGSSKKKGKRGKKASATADDTGLGRWQWSKLLKKNTDESTALSSRRQETEAASSRLANLISRQSSHRSNESRPTSVWRSREEPQSAPDTATKPKKRASLGVTFAPGTAFDPSPTPQNYENRDVTEVSPTSPPRTAEPLSKKPAVLVSGPEPGGTNNDWEDDDDEDW